MTLRFARRLVTVAAVSWAAASCSGDKSELPPAQSSSATHFLEDCATECPAGLECICGTCTRACTSSSVCEDINARASCVARAASHPACQVVTIGHLCDVTCGSDVDCANVSAARHCVDGFCRATTAAERDGGSADASSVGGKGAGGAGGAATAGAGGTSAPTGGTGVSSGGTGAPSGGTGASSGTTSSSGGAGDKDGGSSGAGGSLPAAGAPVVSGTRLKAHYTNAGDGARVYRRGVLFDSMLGTDCTYRFASDGNLRCLPITDSSTLVTEIYYSDDKCTQLYALLPPGTAGCTPVFPKYVVTEEVIGSICSQKAIDHVFEVQGTVLGTAPVPQYKKSGTDCTGGPAYYQGVIAVTIGPERAATDFVEGTKATE